MLSLLKLLHHLSTLATEALSPGVLVQPGAEMLEKTWFLHELHQLRTAAKLLDHRKEHHTNNTRFCT